MRKTAQSSEYSNLAIAKAPRAGRDLPYAYYVSFVVDTDIQSIDRYQEI